MVSMRGRFSPEFKEQMVKAFLDQQATKTVKRPRFLAALIRVAALG